MRFQRENTLPGLQILDIGADCSHDTDIRIANSSRIVGSARYVRRVAKIVAEVSACRQCGDLGFDVHLVGLQ